MTNTLYPAICAVRDRKDVLFEAFVKSNRLALMWALPFGFGGPVATGYLDGPVALEMPPPRLMLMTCAPSSAS